MLRIEQITTQKYKVVGDAKLRDETLKSLVWKHSKHQKGYLFSKAYRDKKWDGKVRLYSPTNFRAGHLLETITTIESAGIPLECNFESIDDEIMNYEEFYKFCSNLIESVRPSFKKKHDIELEVRDYQILSAWKFIKQRTYVKSGIAVHATAAGKSLTISLILGYLFYKNIIKKAVIIVPLQSLVTQFKEDLMDFGFKESFIGTLYSDSKQVNRPLTIAMINSANNMIDTLDGEEFFGKTDLVICDEVHKSISKTCTDVILKMENCRFFFGCTGTLPEDPLEQEIIHSLFGYVIDERKLKELREEYNAVTNIKVGILNFSYGVQGLLSRAKSIVSVKDWQGEVEFLQNDFEFRNPYIIKTVCNNFEKGHKIVVLVKNIDYGTKMYHRIAESLDKSHRKNVYWIDGSMKLSDRDEIKEKCKKSKDPYIIVTNFQIFSTGVNIPNLSMLFLIDGGRSKITVAQTIGRGMRKHKSKEELLIIDCSCDLKYGQKHGRVRKKLYEDEGFPVYEKMVYRTEDAELADKIQNLRDL